MSGLHKYMKALLWIMFMALPMTVQGQIADYSSRVVDAETGEPLVSATVAVASDKATVTNGDGVFSINADADDVLLYGIVYVCGTKSGRTTVRPCPQGRKVRLDLCCADRGTDGNSDFLLCARAPAFV